MLKCEIWASKERGAYAPSRIAVSHNSILRTVFPTYSSMQLTFVTDLGATYTIEIDPKMEFENVMALLEAEVSGFSQASS